MVSRTGRVGVLSVFLVISFVSAGSYPCLAADPIGAIERIEGKGLVQRAGEAQYQELKPNDPVFVQDMIFAPLEEHSKIWWKGLPLREATFLWDETLPSSS